MLLNIAMVVGGLIVGFCLGYFAGKHFTLKNREV